MSPTQPQSNQLAFVAALFICALLLLRYSQSDVPVNGPQFEGVPTVLPPNLASSSSDTNKIDIDNNENSMKNIASSNSLDINEILELAAAAQLMVNVRSYGQVSEHCPMAVMTIEKLE